MPTTPWTVRASTPEDFDAFVRVSSLAFGDDIGAEEAAQERLVFEPSRGLVALDGDEVVGTAAAYSHRLSVPGGEVRCAGTTWVGVRPSHRRAGVLTALMRRHLADAAAEGEPIAALWASEASIYGRFGYGLASERLGLRVDVRRSGFGAHVPPGAGRIDLLGVDEVRDAIAPVYDAVRLRRAGMHARDERWWAYQALADPPSTRQGWSPKTVAVYREGGEALGYAIYSVKGEWGDDGLAGGTVRVHELAGTTLPATASLWRFVLDHDLISNVQAHRQPVDDPLPLLLDDARQARQQRFDALWVAVLDVVGALEGRTWALDVDTVVRVVDEGRPEVAGTYRLRGGPDGAAVVERTSALPDAVLPSTSLGALYLGGADLRRFAAAGLLEVDDPGALARLDAAARAEAAPWAPEVW